LRITTTLEDMIWSRWPSSFRYMVAVTPQTRLIWSRKTLVSLSTIKKTRPARGKTAPGH
jgi:hypothetical protein